MSSSLYAVGTIVKAFGVRGEVIARSISNIPSRFELLQTVFVGPDEENVVLTTLEHVREEERGVRLMLGVSVDRSAAEALVGQILFVEEHDLVPLPEGTYYVHDIIGFNVEDETGRPLGILQEVEKYPAHDVYRVRGVRDILIPAVKEFILRIDRPGRTMIVRLIDGM